MVNTKTIGIERGRIGIAGVELSSTRNRITQPINGLGSIRQGKCVQVWLHCLQCILASIEIGDGCERGLRQPKSKALIRKEEESPVLKNGAAESAAEVVLALLVFGHWSAGEPL